MKVDTIVNATNISYSVVELVLVLCCVDGAIHHVAGKDLLAKYHSLNGYKIGRAKTIKRYKLPAKFASIQLVLYSVVAYCFLPHK